MLSLVIRVPRVTLLISITRCEMVIAIQTYWNKIYTKKLNGFVNTAKSAASSSCNRYVSLQLKEQPFDEMRNYNTGRILICCASSTAGSRVINYKSRCSSSVIGQDVIVTGGNGRWRFTCGRVLYASKLVWRWKKVFYGCCVLGMRLFLYMLY